jgi:hypothetical protein
LSLRTVGERSAAVELAKLMSIATMQWRLIDTILVVDAAAVPGNVRVISITTASAVSVSRGIRIISGGLDALLCGRPHELCLAGRK